MSGNEQDVQAYEKTSGWGGTTLPLFTGLVGLGCAAVALGTAAVPASVGGVNQIVGVLERAGLDKGPLALFGFSLCALAATMWRAGGATASARASEEASLLGQQILGDLGAQSAALAGLRAELGAARTELAEIRQANGISSADGGSAASNPIFRMAASLDQLGAQMSTRIDANRAEFLTAIEGITARIDQLKERSDGNGPGLEAAEQRALIEALRAAQLDATTIAARSADENRDRFESVRGELAELTETVARIARPTDTPATGPAWEGGGTPAAEEPGTAPAFEETASAGFEIEDLAAEQLAPITPPAPFSSPLQISEQGPRPAPNTLVPPQELAEEPFEAEMSAAPDPTLQQEPTRAGATAWTFEDGAAATSEGSPVSDDADAVEPTECGPPFGPALTEITAAHAEEPPAPLPAPSEGLDLLDEMQEDRARPADLTPPLFPELGPELGPDLGNS